MPRLFIAIDISSDIKEDIANICFGVPYAKWIGVEQMHLTLHFLGDIEAGRVPDLVEALDTVKQGSFSIGIKGVGHFPPRTAPRVLWVGVEKSKNLDILHGTIGKALSKAGFEIEKRRFYPHISVARLGERTTMDDIAGFLVANTLFRPARPVEVNGFHLYSSILDRQGAMHSKEAEFQLD